MIIKNNSEVRKIYFSTSPSPMLNYNGSKAWQHIVDEYVPPVYDPKNWLRLEARENGVSFSFTPSVTGNTIEYSTNGGRTWNNLAEGESTPQIYANEAIHFRGMLEPTTDGIGTFSSTGKYMAEGNPFSMTLGDYIDNDYLDLTNREYALKGLFKGDANLVTVWLTLPRNTVAHCYEEMFAGCTSLNEVGLDLFLISTTAYCCKGMFSGCTSMDITFEMPDNLAEGCFENMFSDCTSVQEIPILPIDYLEKYCYRGMFSGCTSLRVDSIPRHNDAKNNFFARYSYAEGCYAYMFEGCTSMVCVPLCSIKCSTLEKDCFRGMFMNCTSLRNFEANILRFSEFADGCCMNMFRGCTSMVVPPDSVSATTIPKDCFRQMFFGCTSLTRGLSYMTSSTSPPFVLGEDCCSQMYRGCTSMTTASPPPAENLVTNCYYAMFYGCSSLRSVYAKFLTTPSAEYTYYWMHGVRSTGTFHKNANATWNVTGSNGIPKNWTVRTY